jgi:TonB family protein
LRALGVLTLMLVALPHAWAAATPTPQPPASDRAPAERCWRLDPTVSIGQEDYPPISLRLHEDGDVVMKVSITAEGIVEDVQIEQSSGFHRLDERAVKIVRERYRYRPNPNVPCAPAATTLTTAIRWHVDKWAVPIGLPCRDQQHAMTEEELNAVRPRSRYRPDVKIIRRQVLIKEDGTIEKILVLTSNRWSDAGPDALRTMNRHELYIPAKKDGVPVKCWIDDDEVVAPPLPASSQ